MSQAFWVAVKELKLSYHSSDTILITICPCYGNLIKFLHSNPVLYKRWMTVVMASFGNGLSEQCCLPLHDNHGSFEPLSVVL